MPTGGHDLAVFIQEHFPIHNVAEQVLPVVGADGDEVRPSLGVIVTGQPNRTAMMDLRVVSGFGHHT